MGKKYRVPHCSVCDRCKYVELFFKDFYCYEDADSNEYGDSIGFLGVDNPPKTSPKWCPKRKEGENKDDKY